MRSSAGFTRLESLFILAVLFVVGFILVPQYMGVVQNACEIRARATLAQIIRGQETFVLLDDDRPGYSGDFEELEGTGSIQNGTNIAPAEVTAAAPEIVRTMSARIHDGYRLDLLADVRTDGTSAWCVTASPTKKRDQRRWFFADQTGVIRSGIGMANTDSPPFS